jgi:predicted transcriptional regulator of viral defense system
MSLLHAFGNHAEAMVDDANKDAGGEARARPAENIAAERRKARLAEQLRANLQRRKQQARARRSGDADDRQGLDDSTDAPKR